MPEADRAAREPDPVGLRRPSAAPFSPTARTIYLAGRVPPRREPLPRGALLGRAVDPPLGFRPPRLSFPRRRRSGPRRSRADEKAERLRIADAEPRLPAERPPAVGGRRVTWLIIPALVLLALLGTPLFVILGGGALIAFALQGISSSAVLTEMSRLATSPILLVDPDVHLRGLHLRREQDARAARAADPLALRMDSREPRARRDGRLRDLHRLYRRQRRHDRRDGRALDAGPGEGRIQPNAIRWA